MLSAYLHLAFSKDGMVINLRFGDKVKARRLLMNLWFPFPPPPSCPADAAIAQFVKFHWSSCCAHSFYKRWIFMDIKVPSKINTYLGIYSQVLEEREIWCQTHSQHMKWNMFILLFCYFPILGGSTTHVNPDIYFITFPAYFIMSILPLPSWNHTLSAWHPTLSSHQIHFANKA